LNEIKKPHLLWLVVALLSVSSSSIIVRFLSDHSANVIAFWRMGLASLLLWLYSGFKKQGNLKPSWKLSVMVAGIFLGFHFGLFFSAVKLTKISNATLLGTTAPLFTLIIEIFILKRRFPFITIFAIMLAFLGVLVVQDFTIDFSSGESKGNFYALAGSLCIALVFLIAEKVRQSTNTVTYCRHLFMWAALTLGGLSLFDSESIFHFSKMDFLFFFLLGVFPSIFGHVIFNYFIKYFSPSIIISVPLGEPLIASIAAFYVFGEQPHSNTLIGGVFTLTGLFILGIKNQANDFVSESD
jgi:drug/metabolite transporter (DMT)-like permease